MPQKKGLEAMRRPGAVIHRIGASTAQVPDRLVGGIRHIHRREISGAKQAGEIFRIPPVGFNPVARLLRDQRGGYDRAGDPKLLQSPRDHEPARPRLVADVQPAFPVFSDPPQELF